MGAINVSMFLLCSLALTLRAADFHIEHSTVLTSSGEYHWSQSRPAVIPGKVIVTTQELEKRGSHGYREIHLAETTDNANMQASIWPRDLPRGCERHRDLGRQQ